MKILIIGGSGFLGSRILHHFSLKNHEITVITRGIHKIDAKDKCKYIQIDRKKRTKFKSSLMKYEFDWVIDVCAMEHQDTEEIIEIFKNRISHFLHISTDAVYDFAHLENYSTFPIFESDKQGDLTDSHEFLLIITGIFLGIFTEIKSKNWVIFLIIKHLTVFIMITIHICRIKIIAPLIQKKGNENPSSKSYLKLKSLQMNLVWVNLVLGMITLFISVIL